MVRADARLVTYHSSIQSLVAFCAILVLLQYGFWRWLVGEWGASNHRFKRMVVAHMPAVQ